MLGFVEAVNMVRQYVTKIRLNISPREEAPYVIDYKETEKDKAFVICPNYRDFGNCRYWQNCDEYECKKKNYLFYQYSYLTESHQLNLDFLDRGIILKFIVKETW
jgi:hypothetical protein